jgi:DNA-binding transcriptional LysR family regulator
MANMRPLSDLQLLRAFVAVARNGSVSAAARVLHLSQPTVSLQLRALAEHTGLVLFTRQSRGLALTHEGAALLAQAERVLGSLAEFNGIVGGLQGAVRGTLRVGTILDPPFTRLGAFLRRLVEGAPQLDIELSQAMSGTVLEQVRSGVLDGGFYLADAPLAAEAGITERVLTRFHYRVVAPAGWGARVLGCGWPELAALPWLATPPQSAHHRLLATVFGPGSSAGLEPRRVARVDQEASMIDLVKSGVGLSLMRDSIALAESQAHGLVIADRVSLPCALCFICAQARRQEPAINAAWEAIEAVWPG